MSNITTREQEIEALRNRLNVLVMEKGGNLKHPEVMDLSSQLDKLIVDWQRHKGRNS